MKTVSEIDREAELCRLNRNRLVNFYRRRQRESRKAGLTFNAFNRRHWWIKIYLNHELNGGDYE